MAAPVPPAIETTVTTVVDNGPPAEKIDIAIIADGYEADQEGKFGRDVEAMRNVCSKPSLSNRTNLSSTCTAFLSLQTKVALDTIVLGIRSSIVIVKNEIRDTPFQTIFVISALADTQISTWAIPATASQCRSKSLRSTKRRSLRWRTK